MTGISLLLSNPSPCLRWQVLKELKDSSEEELEELYAIRHLDPIVQSLLKLQNNDGSFKPDTLTATTSVVQATSIGLVKLGFLGFDYNFPQVMKGAEYLFSQQRSDGAWDFQEIGDEGDEQYDMVPLQTGYPLWGLASVGLARHINSEKAYKWLMAQQLDDGAWPVGFASGNYGYIAGYRKLPNSRQGCRVNTTCALLALSLHPTRRNNINVQRALDVLLGRQTLDKHCMGFNIARFIGVEPSKGFFSFFANHDLALVADLIWKIGGGMQDKRITRLVEFIKKTQGPLGLWEYSPSPLVTHWLTFSLQKSLARIQYNEEWVGMTPDVAFQQYKKTKKRY
ncbi:MAG: terpene cyclase/mutase family protein [Bacteroidetes bacterium]|nr:terpene cyclase/mutase family protein [Bacteroidota bacterium]